MPLVYKLIPQLAAWAVLALLLYRGFPGRRRVVTLSAGIWFAAGVAGFMALSRLVAVKAPMEILRSAVGAGFFCLWIVAVGALYRSAVREFPLFRLGRLFDTSFPTGCVTALTGVIIGGICAAGLPGFDGVALQLLAGSALAVAGMAVLLVADFGEKRLSPLLSVTPATLFTGLVSLLLFASSAVLLLDLFAPLSMKVMKGIHDFVHQFMESILIPDHVFIRPPIWKAIGLLFGKEVGFWGGLIIWFTPVILVALALQVEPLPSVAHIRQGAQRRRLLAQALLTKRCRLVIPAVALVALVAAVYRSSFPSVEYWDPKPVPVTATPAGEIFIPGKGEITLEDGKLHKFVYKQGGKEVRFFVLMTPAGTLTVDLDACAICKPDGYGQAEGMVICYYCKTLIPLDTVGKPGGCNPVPVPFTQREDGVRLDALTLFNTWNQTVQATARTGEGGK